MHCFSVNAPIDLTCDEKKGRKDKAFFFLKYLKHIIFQTSLSSDVYLHKGYVIEEVKSKKKMK